jgi:hypothetical protein
MGGEIGEPVKIGFFKGPKCETIGALMALSSKN